MFDDPGDLDHNGIPDAIQADPVIVPPEPGLPGIDAPIEATAEATAPPIPEPVAPPAPPADADEATIAAYERAVVDYRQAMQTYGQMLDALTSIANMQHETQKSIIQNIRA